MFPEVASQNCVPRDPVRVFPASHFGRSFTHPSSHFGYIPGGQMFFPPLGVMRRVFPLLSFVIVYFSASHQRLLPMVLLMFGIVPFGQLPLRDSL